MIWITHKASVWWISIIIGNFRIGRTTANSILYIRGANPILTIMAIDCGGGIQASINLLWIGPPCLILLCFKSIFASSSCQWLTRQNFKGALEICSGFFTLLTQDTSIIPLQGITVVVLPLPRTSPPQGQPGTSRCKSCHRRCLRSIASPRTPGTWQHTSRRRHHPRRRRRGLSRWTGRAGDFKSTPRPLSRGSSRTMVLYWLRRSRRGSGEQAHPGNVWTDIIVTVLLSCDCQLQWMCF